MKISKRTLAILKNFASINQSIVIRPGNKIETISNHKDLLGSVEVEETFPIEFAIYDLNELLGALSLFEDPDIEFDPESLVISEGNSTQRYYYADKSVITQVPEQGVTLPSVEVTAKLTKEQLPRLIRAAAINNLTDLAFVNGSVKVYDKNVPNSNSFSISDIATHDQDYELPIAVEKMKMVPDDYEIEICSRGLSKFVGSQGITYLVALQSGGKYGS